MHHSDIVIRREILDVRSELNRRFEKYIFSMCRCACRDKQYARYNMGENTASLSMTFCQDIPTSGWRIIEHKTIG